MAVRGMPNIAQMDRATLEMFARQCMAAVQRSTKRFQLVSCELQQVDGDNKIFDLGEGVFDKEFLYLTRKTIKDGSYSKLRDGCRIKRRSQNLKPGG